MLTENLAIPEGRQQDNQNSDLPGKPLFGPRIEKQRGTFGAVNSKRRSILGRFIKTKHKRLSKVLGYALTLGPGTGWQAFSAIAAAYLSDQEKVSLAFAALSALDPDLAEQTAAAALNAAGAPLPPFLGGMDDARYWASIASRSELKAYALAAHDALSPRDQAAFFQIIREVEIAA